MYAAADTLPLFVLSPNMYSVIYLTGHPPAFRAGILEQSTVARNRVEIGLSYRPARLVRLHRLTESIPWNRVLGIDSWAP